MGHPPNSPSEELLKPREVAEIFGVRTTTIARWAREGRLTPLRTPGGHRRYTWPGIRGLLDAETGSGAAEAFAEEAARLYEQGWTIRQVAERFGCGHGAMRRVLRGRVVLRDRGGTPRRTP